MKDYEWGPWVEHDGGPQPVENGVVSQIVMFDPVGEVRDEVTEMTVGQPWESENYISHGLKDDFEWPVPIPPSQGIIIRYRIRRPKALQQLVQMVESLTVQVNDKEEV